MAIDLQIIRNHLDQAELKYDIDEERKMAYFPVTTEDAELGKIRTIVFITLQEQGEYIQFRAYPDHDIVPQEAIKSSPYLTVLLKHLIHLNYTRKIGRWCFDPSDGDMYIDHGLPLEDNAQVTFKQFERLRSTLVRSMFEAMPEIKRIVETGSSEKLDAAKIILDAINLSIEHGNMSLVQKLAGLKNKAAPTLLIDLQNAVTEKNIPAIEQALENL